VADVISKVRELWNRKNIDFRQIAMCRKPLFLRSAKLILESDTLDGKWAYFGANGKLLLAVPFLVRRSENMWAKLGQKPDSLLTADRSTTELLWIVSPAH